MMNKRCFKEQHSPVEYFYFFQKRSRKNANNRQGKSVLLTKKARSLAHAMSMKRNKH